MKRLIVFLLSMGLMLASTADDSIPDLRKQELKNLLIQDCGSCHGLRMKGGLGPALLAENLRGKPAAYISKIILDGRPGTAMPGWRPLLSEKEADWITTLLMEKP